MSLAATATRGDTMAAKNLGRILRLEGIDSDLERVQNNIAKVVDSISEIQILDGLFIKNVTLTPSSVNRVAHKLNRTPQGWIVIRRSSSGNVWDNTAPDRTYLYLNASAVTEISLWVF